MRRAWAVAAKELLDLSRDRRALLLGLLVPALSVPLLSLLVEADTSRRLSSPARVAVVRSAGAEELLRFAQGLVEAVPVADAQEALRTGQVSAVVEVRQADKGGALQEVVVRYRARDPEGLVARERVAQVVARYSLPLVDRALRAHGLDREALTPVRLRDEPVPGGAGWAGSLVPLVVVVWSFAGASLVAADLTAGEKERGAWDILRCAPVSRWSLVAGKFVACWWAGTALAAVATAAQLAASAAGFPGIPQAVVLLLAAACASALAGGASLAVGMVSRSAREAHQWTFPLYLLAMAGATGSGSLAGWPPAAAVPVLNAFLLAQRAAAGGLPEASQLAWAVATSAAACALLLATCTRLVDRE
ncbi:MAG: ABC transporter permease subunit [Armatimonadota bacterium]|nr:ABC transporter permease subunit [Armatimonadota bacterium]MDW8156929.1 ABC transporter permease subunit [Armatimonadota bacterium]